MKRYSNQSQGGGNTIFTLLMVAVLIVAVAWVMNSVKTPHAYPITDNPIVTQASQIEIIGHSQGGGLATPKP